MKQFYRDMCGNTATITKTQESAKLICRNYYGKVWKRGQYRTVRDAKQALELTGEWWHTVKGYVTD